MNAAETPPQPSTQFPSDLSPPRARRPPARASSAPNPSTTHPQSRAVPKSPAHDRETRNSQIILSECLTSHDRHVAPFRSRARARTRYLAIHLAQHRRASSILRVSRVGARWRERTVCETRDERGDSGASAPRDVFFTHIASRARVRRNACV
jgi:hypothetical protein